MGKAASSVRVKGGPWRARSGPLGPVRKKLWHCREETRVRTQAATEAARRDVRCSQGHGKSRIGKT